MTMMMSREKMQMWKGEDAVFGEEVINQQRSSSKEFKVILKIYTALLFIL